MIYMDPETQTAAIRELQEEVLALRRELESQRETLTGMDINVGRRLGAIEDMLGILGP